MKIVIVSCKKVREQNICPGDAKCMVALMRREGEFERYKDKDAAIVGIVDCGDCPGTRVIPNLGVLKLQLASLNETVDVVHLGTCVVSVCPYKDDIVEALKKKAGVEVVEGTHKYLPEKIFP
ncbi:MAG: CGGC domain-containing protein [Archaeoglobales archaeon]|nr:MAG: CGGC domain-containing protein [Archaeoglobales archaeon]